MGVKKQPSVGSRKRCDSAAGGNSTLAADLCQPLYGARAAPTMPIAVIQGTLRSMLILAVLLPTVAAAQAEALTHAAEEFDWRVTPSISVSETFTDNAFLEPSGQAEWDFVTRITPRVSVAGRGNRVQFNFSASARAVHYIRNSDRDDLFLLARGRGNVEVVDNHFFVESKLRRSRKLASLLGPISPFGANNTENLVTATVFSISPYLLNRFGDFATSALRYTRQQAWYKGRTADEGYTNRYSASLSSGEAFDRLFWGLDASREVVEQEDERDSGTFNKASATLGYRLTRHLSISATGGYEDNDYESFRNTIDGAFWNVGFRWVPTQRTSIRARYGERFFGNTGTLQITHRRRTTLWQVSYTEAVRSTRNMVLQQVGTISGFFDDTSVNDSVPRCGPATFDPITNPSCQAIDIALIRPQLVDDFFVAEIWRASVTAFGPSQSLTLAYTSLHRTFERDGAEETQRGLSLSYRLDLGPRTRFNADAGWAHNELVRQSRTDTIWYVRAGLSHEVSQSATASVSIRHLRRSSNEAPAEYRENAITASFTYQF